MACKRKTTHVPGHVHCQRNNPVWYLRRHKLAQSGLSACFPATGDRVAGNFTSGFDHPRGRFVHIPPLCRSSQSGCASVHMTRSFHSRVAHASRNPLSHRGLSFIIRRPTQTMTTHLLSCIFLVSPFFMHVMASVSHPLQVSHIQLWMDQGYHTVAQAKRPWILGYGVPPMSHVGPLWSQLMHLGRH